VDLDQPRRPRRAGRLWRRIRREPVPAFVYPDDYLGWFDDDDGEGSAGVREPRHPLPLGPMAGAGEAPLPEPPLFARLPDPRY
jgi:hypothetical protein